MFVLKIENDENEKLILTQNESNYQVVNIEGLLPPEAEIFTSEVANMDGESFKSSKLNMRNIVLQIRLNGEVEKNRIKLYRFCNTCKRCKIYYKNNSRDVFIEGYVEVIEGDLFTESEILQVSIICPEPYWKELNFIKIDISKEFANFEFPFAIDKEGIEFSKINLNREALIVNSGETETGIKIKIISEADNISDIGIYNITTNQFMKINTILNTGDSIVINTMRGKKSIVKTVNNIEENILGSLVTGSTWLQLKLGQNYFLYTSEPLTKDLKVSIEFNNLYKGV